MNVDTPAAPEVDWFAAMSPRRKAWEGVGGPIVAGAITGTLLGLTSWGFFVLCAVSALAGAFAGTQHRTVGGLLIRTTVAGILWGSTVLAVSAATGWEPKAALLEPKWTLILLAVAVNWIVEFSVWAMTARKAEHV